MKKQIENIVFPNFGNENFSNTRNTIQLYAQLISAIKGNLVPHQKNWEEYSLKIYAKGFTTTSIPIQTDGGIEALDLNLNIIEHKLKMFYKDNRNEISLEQTSIAEFTQKLFEIFELHKITIEKLDDKFYTTDQLQYNKIEVSNLWNLFRQAYFLLLKFRGSTLKETSNINFWPHHFDLAMLVFSGKLVDGQNISNWDYSREQMNFGLSSGDSGITEPYFYITAYPFDKALLNIKLPAFAEWHTEGWNGLVVKLSNIANHKEVFSPLLKLFTNLLNENYKLTN